MHAHETYTRNAIRYINQSMPLIHGRAFSRLPIYLSTNQRRSYMDVPSPVSRYTYQPINAARTWTYLLPSPRVSLLSAWCLRAGNNAASSCLRHPPTRNLNTRKTLLQLCAMIQRHESSLAMLAIYDSTFCCITCIMYCWSQYRDDTFRELGHTGGDITMLLEEF